MTTRTITRPEDWRVGDTATIDCNGHTATGEAWECEGALLVGSSTIRWSDGGMPAGLTITVTREVRDLPTEPGSVILVSEVRDSSVNQRFDKPCVATLDNDGLWCVTPTTPSGDRWFSDDEIIDWQPAKEVPE